MSITTPEELEPLLLGRATAAGRPVEQVTVEHVTPGLIAQGSVLEQEASANRKARAARRTMSEWYGRLEEAEVFPALSYWQAQSDEAKFATAWEMVVEAHRIKGEDLSESRLQRSVGGLQRRAG